MCGRFAFYSPSEATAALFGASSTKEVVARYNIAPTQFIAAVRNDEENTPELAMLRWGLVPFWARDPSIGNRMINARAETAHEKPSFRAAFKRRRCVILADGFYEWRREGDRKTPYFIVMESRHPFAMAGLWEHWNGPEDAELQSCAILTMAANDVMKPLHDRMPVILSPDTARRWCGSESDDRKAARATLAETENASLVYWPVSTVVNNPRNDGPDLVNSVPA